MTRAEAQNAEDFETEEEDGQLTITRYTGSEKDVCIPERINGLPVTSIGKGAFSGNQLTSVTIPNSVTSIGKWAFDDGVQIIREK
jgi:hypothetical protein